MVHVYAFWQMLSLRADSRTVTLRSCFYTQHSAFAVGQELPPDPPRLIDATIRKHAMLHSTPP